MQGAGPGHLLCFNLWSYAEHDQDDDNDDNDDSDDDDDNDNDDNLLQRKITQFSGNILGKHQNSSFVANKKGYYVIEFSCTQHFILVNTIKIWNIAA